MQQLRLLHRCQTLHQGKTSQSWDYGCKATKTFVLFPTILRESSQIYLDWPRLNAASKRSHTRILRNCTSFAFCYLATTRSKKSSRTLLKIFVHCYCWILVSTWSPYMQWKQFLMELYPNLDGNKVSSVDAGTFTNLKQLNKLFLFDNVCINRKFDSDDDFKILLEIGLTSCVEGVRSSSSKVGGQIPEHLKKTLLGQEKDSNEWYNKDTI